MKAVNKISMMSFVLAALYGSSSFAATPALIFTSQPMAHTMTTQSSQVLKYTISNTTTQAIKINKIDVGPGDNPNYWATSNDCQNVVAAGQSCHINLSLYSPSESGFMNTALIISYGQPNTVLHSRPIQFDVTGNPGSKATLASTSQSVAHTTSNTKHVQTSSGVTSVPVMVVTSQKTGTFVPLKDTQAAYNTSGAQINVYAGWSNTTTHKSNIVFNQYETDSLVGSDNSTNFTPGVGVSYDFVLNPNGGFIHAVGLGVDFFNQNFDRTGQVYQYQLPQFNNYRYKADLNSAQLLLNGEVDLHPLWHGLTFFAEGGVGGAYNQVKYSETAQPGIIGGELNMPSNLTMNFAYDIGGGVKLPVSSNLELSFRYLYTNPGDAETNVEADDGVMLQKPIKFDLTSNTWLFGLSYLIR